MVPPRDLPQSILIYCLYMYIYIYIYYLCAYMYKSQLFFKDVLWVVAVHTIKTSWKQKTIFDDSFGENPWGKQKKQKTSRKPTKNNIWRLFGKALLTKSKKPRENQKNKKTKLFRESLVWGSCLVFFWFCLGFFGFFGLDLEKTKKLKVFLVFWIKWWLKKCEKKTQGFFLFLGVCGFSFFLAAQWKTKKNLEFFWFFTLL